MHETCPLHRTRVTGPAVAGEETLVPWPHFSELQPSPVFRRERDLVIMARSGWLAAGASRADSGHGPDPGSSASLHFVSLSPPRAQWHAQTSRTWETP